MGEACFDYHTYWGYKCSINVPAMAAARHEYLFPYVCIYCLANAPTAVAVTRHFLPSRANGRHTALLLYDTLALMTSHTRLYADKRLRLRLSI